MPVGVMVTLRGSRMYEFLDSFITSTMPRIRDFNGISDKGFDGRGNYTMGIKEQIAFPEISIDKINNITGMDITFVTNTDSDSDALLLLKELGLPFKQNDAAEKARDEQIKKEQEEKENKLRRKQKQQILNRVDEVSDIQENNSRKATENNNELSDESDKIRKLKIWQKNQ